MQGRLRGVMSGRISKGKLEKATGQVLPSAKYRPMRVVVDSAFRHGDHKIANISLNCQRILKRISPMDSAYFCGRSGG